VNADQHATVDSLAETNESAQTCRRPQPQLPKQPSAELDVPMCPTPKRWLYEHRNAFQIAAEATARKERYMSSR